MNKIFHFCLYCGNWTFQFWIAGCFGAPTRNRTWAARVVGKLPNTEPEVQPEVHFYRKSGTVDWYGWNGSRNWWNALWSGFVLSNEICVWPPKVGLCYFLVVRILISIEIYISCKRGVIYTKRINSKCTCTFIKL